MHLAHAANYSTPIGTDAVGHTPDAWLGGAARPCGGQAVPTARTALVSRHAPTQPSIAVTTLCDSIACKHLLIQVDAESWLLRYRDVAIDNGKGLLRECLPQR